MDQEAVPRLGEQTLGQDTDLAVDELVVLDRGSSRGGDQGNVPDPRVRAVVGDVVSHEGRLSVFVDQHDGGRRRDSGTRAVAVCSLPTFRISFRSILTEAVVASAPSPKHSPECVFISSVPTSSTTFRWRRYCR